VDVALLILAVIVAWLFQKSQAANGGASAATPGIGSGELVDEYGMPLDTPQDWAANWNDPTVPTPIKSPRNT